MLSPRGAWELLRRMPATVEPPAGVVGVRSSAGMPDSEVGHVDVQLKDGARTLPRRRQGHPGLLREPPARQLLGPPHDHRQAARKKREAIMLGRGMVLRRLASAGGQKRQKGF